MRVLTNYYLRVPPEIVVWIFDTLDNVFKIENRFTKCFKESCMYFLIVSTYTVVSNSLPVCKLYI